jgi:hypothetical protein
MWHSLRLWLALLGVGIGGWLIFSALARERTAPVTEDELPLMVFVDRESGELFVGKVRPTPAVHPRLGEPRLLPGWYCPQCAKWYAGPPSDAAERTVDVVRCPKTRDPLHREGPLPAAAPEI